MYKPFIYDFPGFIVNIIWSYKIVEINKISSYMKKETFLTEKL